MTPALGRPQEARFALHERVRAFIRASLAERHTPESFDQLGLAIAAQQAARIDACSRLLAVCGIDPRQARSVRELPAVPTDAFRLTRIAAHDPVEDRAVFFTSGTTSTMGSRRGTHALSTIDTYDAAALGWGAWGLFPDAPRRLVAIVLGPWKTDRPARDTPGESSLGYMVRRFVEAFATDAHVVVANGEGGSAAGTIDVPAILAACDTARRGGTPVAILGTSFALVHLLEALQGHRIVLPAGSRVMHTGGFKGRSREVEPGELRRFVAETFELQESAIVGEYGMTELSSQLYEGCLRAALGFETPSSLHGIFVPPPWVRVVAVDPTSLLPVEDGHEGLLRIEDLANVDSALVIQTADRGRVVGGGVALLGRAKDAPPRGCSLAADDMMHVQVRVS